MPVLGWVAVASCAAFVAAVFSLLGYRDLAWRIRQRRRRHVPFEFGGKRL